MAMEMTAVWKERKSKSPFPLSHTALESSQKTASFPHSHSFGDDWRFPFFSNSFNFNFDEKCYLHARYLLLPTCPTAQRLCACRLIEAAEVRFSRPSGQSHVFSPLS